MTAKTAGDPIELTDTKGGRDAPGIPNYEPDLNIEKAKMEATDGQQPPI